jgi:hypothetical protein
MRRKIEDWERAEEMATPYTRAQVDQFSPRSQAILEIQSRRDLEILEKIYANSVLLGDDGPDGWGIKYTREFDMTNDSKLFPPRTKWEEQGYRPDEYSRWLKGDWRPIAELWVELGIDPVRVTPPGVELEEWLFDTTAGPERRTAEARFVHGHLLKPGDVARTSSRLRCAQPPYDTLPIPRADIPAGILLSREADAWIREERVEDVALPLYQGVMINLMNPYAARHVSGSGASAVWDRTLNERGEIQPAFLVNSSAASQSGKWLSQPRLAYRRIARTTDARTVVASAQMGLPAGDSLFFYVPQTSQITLALLLSSVMTSFFYDHQVRQRLGGTNLSDFIMAETALPQVSSVSTLIHSAAALNLYSVCDSVAWMNVPTEKSIRSSWLIHLSSRLQARVAQDAVMAANFNLDTHMTRQILDQCDIPAAQIAKQVQALNPTGFWRVDKDKDPELRHTVLTLIAFHDLEAKIREHGGDRDAGIAAFLAQNDGEGWLLPETLRLADYGLGHDERAQHHQPVASRLGPRFYDWQLAQTAEESWRECHLHARNLLGEAGYQKLLAEIDGNGTKPVSDEPPASHPGHDGRQIRLFEDGNGQKTLFD